MIKMRHLIQALNKVSSNKLFELKHGQTEIYLFYTGPIL